MKVLKLEQNKELHVYTTTKVSNKELKTIANKNNVTGYKTNLFESYIMAGIVPVFDYYKYVLNY